ncbi:hypothetical protein KAS41_00600 [Candidatus Parcubacteria bacterium]|nr:hypothetical protein [Candidatus Parcubacteria bacterium]
MSNSSQIELPADVPCNCPYRQDVSFWDGIDLVLTPPAEAENQGIINCLNDSRIGPFGIIIKDV